MATTYTIPMRLNEAHRPDNVAQVEPKVFESIVIIFHLVPVSLARMENKNILFFSDFSSHCKLKIPIVEKGNKKKVA